MLLSPRCTRYSTIDLIRTAHTSWPGAMLAGVEVRPAFLGDGHNRKLVAMLQALRWKGGCDLRDIDHPYHGTWTLFESWCHEHELVPHIDCKRGATASESWHRIYVSAEGDRS